MSEKTPLTKRAAKLAVLTVGGGVALTFAMAGSASADDVTVQDANVTNAGAAAANSGGNVSVGNASTNVASNNQGAAGLIASNNGTATNQSNGSSSVTTGQATATGSTAATGVDQAAQGDGGPGLDVSVQDADVTNAGIAAANSGGNVGIGNASTNVAVNAQGAAGGVASNNGGASNKSDGTSEITTGAATATGNQSITKVKQAATHDDGPGLGLGIVVQTTDVLNLGAAAANSGGNIGIGNASGNLALNLQGAGGLFASNNGSASNKSNGKSTIKTGAASATGNKSLTDISQAADPADGPGLSLVVQDADVLNLGVAAANSGGNIGIGNISGNLAVNAQGALGPGGEQQRWCLERVQRHDRDHHRCGHRHRQRVRHQGQAGRRSGSGRPRPRVPERPGDQRRSRRRQQRPQRRRGQRLVQRGDPRPGVVRPPGQQQQRRHVQPVRRLHHHPHRCRLGRWQPGHDQRRAGRLIHR